MQRASSCDEAAVVSVVRKNSWWPRLPSAGQGSRRSTVLQRRSWS